MEAYEKNEKAYEEKVLSMCMPEIRNYGSYVLWWRKYLYSKAILLWQTFRPLAWGNDSSNTGPNRKWNPKTQYLRGECSKNVRQNQKVIVCAECEDCFHAKCLDMSGEILLNAMQSIEILTGFVLDVRCRISVNRFFWGQLWVNGESNQSLNLKIYLY